MWWRELRQHEWDSWDACHRAFAHTLMDSRPLFRVALHLHSRLCCCCCCWDQHTCRTCMASSVSKPEAWRALHLRVWSRGIDDGWDQHTCGKCMASSAAKPEAWQELRFRVLSKGTDDGWNQHAFGRCMANSAFKPEASARAALTDVEQSH